jgi:hypothetical protein
VEEMNMIEINDSSRLQVIKSKEPITPLSPGNWLYELLGGSL